MKKSLILFVLILAGCQATNHNVKSGNLGSSFDELQMDKLLDSNTEVEVNRIVSANWVVPLKGLLYLKDPEAKRNKIENRDEAIQVFTYVIRHPKFGYYLVDTGFSRAIINDPSKYGINFIMKKAMNIEALKIEKSAGEIVNSLPEKPKGIFFTHLHIDHVAGLPEIPNDIPLYIGPTESTEKYFINMFVQSQTDKILEGKSDLLEWDFSKSKVVDIFGDQSVFALSVPGHTSGSVAYIVRSKSGPILITGDTSHTKWGWDHLVPPGDFTRDIGMNRLSLEWLKALSLKHPKMTVYLGHQ